MQVGKLPNEVLKEAIIDRIKRFSEDVVVGPSVGEDCSIVKFGDDACVLTTDPVTAAAKDAGTIGIHICCNDIASAGVRPIGVLVTLLVPPSSELEDIKKVMDDVNKACGELKIDILGGHTEVTDAVNRIVLSITAIGKGKLNSVVTTGGARVGDDIVVTGYAGLEGTSIIAGDYYEGLKDKINDDVLVKAANMVNNISVVDVGLIASDFGVNAMHDATEGGVLGAIWEVAEASNKGVYVYKDRIPMAYETNVICKHINIDAYRLISSGCMIIACADGKGLCKILMDKGINAAIVGKITEKDNIIISSQGEEPILPPEADEIYKVNMEFLKEAKNE